MPPYRPAALGAAAAVLAAATAAGALPSGSAPVYRNVAEATNPFLGASGLGDTAHLGPRLAPSAEIQRGVAALGDVQATYTRFGTVASLVPAPGGWVATGLTGEPARAARAWVAAHAGLFGLSPADVAGLELLNDAVLTGSPAHAVLFRQRLGGLAVQEDGLIAVGIRDGNIASVTSSASGNHVLDATTPAIAAQAAVLAAARDAGLTVDAGDLTPGAVDPAGFTHVAAKGFPAPQRARLAALLTTDRGARLAWETDVLDTRSTQPVATQTFVDALTGEVLVRHDVVDSYSASPNSARMISAPTMLAATTPGTFTTDFTPKTCGSPVALTVPAGTVTLGVVANATIPSNDIALTVFENGLSIGSSDTATSPEAVTATLAKPSTVADHFSAVVCPSTAPAAPLTAPYTVEGSYVASDTAGPSGTGLSYPPTWRAFQDSPKLDYSSTDNRAKLCWTRGGGATDSKSVPDCQIDVSNLASRAPYDVLTQTGTPSFATVGNNAITANTQESTTLTPGAPETPSTSTTRDYGSTFTNQWNASRCDPTVFATPQSADVSASTTNLFVGHNRLHDFAYRLGFTERNYNLQQNNYGLTGPAAQNDPELGNDQNGAATNLPIATISGATGMSLPVTGRDNANQIALQDGVPGITNQYLFQSLLGFYAPCADGALDSTIFLHEYTHAISNRMIAGPDTGLSGAQGGAMGESWSDLDALEYLHELGLAGSNGEAPESLGAYATGNLYRGIRDWNIADSPLTYGDFGGDTTGPEVHADGEIWNAIQWHVRQALITANNARANASDAALQKACALGTFANGTPAPGFTGCPGNRHWIQYIYDAWLLQANGAPTYVDMKNEMLAAAALRGEPGDQAAMAEAFAQKGLGSNATSVDGNDVHPQPGFASPVAAHNSQVTFQLVDTNSGAAVPGEVYVGSYVARATPAATTEGGHAQPATAPFAAGVYQLVTRANGYGEQRFLLTVAPGTTTVTLRLCKNLASSFNGATITAGPDAVRPGDLIDDTEATDAGINSTTSKTALAGQVFTVALRGRHAVQRFAVSAEHRPLDAANSADFQSRLTDLRSFVLQVSSDGGSTYHTVYTSPSNFFPGGVPRTVAPDVLLRQISLASPVTADHVRLVVQANQCTGQPAFAGDHDADPTNNPDCPSTTNALRVTVAELEVFGGPAPTGGAATPAALGAGGTGVLSTRTSAVPR